MVEWSKQLISVDWEWAQAQHTHTQHTHTQLKPSTHSGQASKSTTLHYTHTHTHTQDIQEQSFRVTAYFNQTHLFLCSLYTHTQITPNPHPALHTDTEPHTSTRLHRH